MTSKTFVRAKPTAFLFASPKTRMRVELSSSSTVLRLRGSTGQTRFGPRSAQPLAYRGMTRPAVLARFFRSQALFLCMRPQETPV